MRMRRKPHLTERMEQCHSVWIRDPAAMKGHWRDRLPQARELRLEIGCGKGKFTAAAAAAEPDVLFVALEKCADAMVMAMETARDAGLQNVLFAQADAANLTDLLGPGEAERIYLNFCDPWPSNRHRKLRLTYRDFLHKYQTVLAPGGYLAFRTDNRDLFRFSKLELTGQGWRLENLTEDRHADGPQEPMTGYEEKFYAQGLPICALDAWPPTEERKDVQP